VGFSELDSLMVWLVPLLGSSCFLFLRPHMISYLVLFNSREDREHDEFGASGSACLSAEKPTGHRYSEGQSRLLKSLDRRYR
jgi:hypothetical protein